jgi:hypothetical protein
LRRRFKTKLAKIPAKEAFGSMAGRTDKDSGKPVEYCKKQFEKNIARDFSRLKNS